MAKKKRQFDAGGKCPICGKSFRSEDCPHSITQAEERVAEQSLRSIIREEIERVEKVTIIPAPRPADESKHTFIRESFQECPACAAKPGSPTLCAECLERRELYYLAKRHGLLPHQKRRK